MSVVTVELQYQSTTGEYFIGIDDNGEKRWFDRRHHSEIRVVGERLIVEIDERKWKRRTQSALVTKPKDDGCKDRKCLMCRTTFRAEKNIFICTPCKETAEWRNGSTIFDPV